MHPLPRRSTDAATTAAKPPGGTTRRIAAIGAALLAGSGLVVAVQAPASAALGQVGPIDTATNFPSWYADETGLALQLCLDGDPLCLAGSDLVDIHNAGGDAEAFYFAADATAGPLDVHLALEAAYNAEGADQEVVFQRTQVSSKDGGLQANARYTVSDPYGTFTCVADANGEIVNNACRTETDVIRRNFTEALTGRIGPFLTWDTFGSATGAPPAGYIGDNVTPHKVTGSPIGFNKVQVSGPGLAGTCINPQGVSISNCRETDLFIVQGKVQASTSVNNPSTPDLAAASDSGRVATDNITSVTTPTFTGTAPAGSTVSLVVGADTVGTAVTGTDGRYSVSPTAALTDGRYPVKVSIDNPDVATDPTAAPTLVSGTLNVTIDTTAPPVKMDSPLPTDGTTNVNPQLFFSSTEANTSFECQLSRNATVVSSWAACASGISYDSQPTNNRYTFEARATDPAGNVSAPVASHTWAIGSVVAAPGVPAIGTPTAGNASAVVRWTAGAGGAATGYTVRAYENGGTTVSATATAGQGATSATVSSLRNGTPYTFDVTATNAGGSATSARSVSVTPQAAATVPGAPTIGTASAGNASATVRWTAPSSTGGSALTSYEVQVFQGATSTTVSRTVTGISPTATSTVVSGLTNGTAYRFKVRARNAVGVGPASTAYSNAVTPATVPGAPTIGTASAGNASATVRWTAPSSTGGSTLTSYEVQVFQGATSTTVSRTVTGISPTATSTVVSGLTNGTAYRFKVRARNAAGVGPASTAYSNAVTPTATTTATVPARPATPAATSGAAGGAITASVSWTAPASGGSPITSYTVRALRMSSTGTVLGTTTVSGVSANARSLAVTVPQTGNYRFTVQAHNAVGASQQSPRSNQVAGR